MTDFGFVPSGKTSPTRSDNWLGSGNTRPAFPSPQQIDLLARRPPAPSARESGERPEKIIVKAKNCAGYSSGNKHEGQ